MCDNNLQVEDYNSRSVVRVCVRKAFVSAVSLRLCMSVSVLCFCYERVVIECFKGTGLGLCSE